MSLTFYYAPMSTASITQLVIEELGVKCETVKVDIREGGTKTADYLKLNPNGKVPLIVHDNVSIWESAAITMYLGEAFGVEKNLYPAPGTKRGEAMKWVTWANVTLGESISRFARNSGMWGEDCRHEKGAAAAQTDIAENLRILDEALAGKSYLLGEYSIVDTHLNSLVDWMRHMKMDIDKYKNVSAWSGRCTARPAYAKVMSAAGS